MERKLPKPQLNINCPKCRKFVKSTASKQLSDQTRCIAECKGCKIKILNISKHNGLNWNSINEQIDEKTFKKYLQNFKEKSKRVHGGKNKELILDFLAKKKQGSNYKKHNMQGASAQASHCAESSKKIKR